MRMMVVPIRPGVLQMLLASAGKIDEMRLRSEFGRL
jgi:hypothetical protein